MNETQKKLSLSLTWPKERIFSFTDSVFAFAVTLLVLNLLNTRIPASNAGIFTALRRSLPTFISYAITFVIVIRFWMSHMRLFANIQEFDRTIISLNGFLLFFITLFPFTAVILGNRITNIDAVIMYATCFAAIGIFQYLIGWHAYQKKLFIGDDMTSHFLKVFTIYSLTAPIVFIISIGVAFISPVAAELLWILLVFIRSAFLYIYRNNNLAEEDVRRL
jgi:uncharacterized membrane protein